MKRFLVFTIPAISLLIMISAFTPFELKDKLKGAFKLMALNEEHVIIFADGYFTHTVFDQQAKKFIYTRGGTFKLTDEDLEVLYEFDTKDNNQVSQIVHYKVGVEEDELELNLNGEKQEWTRMDKGDKGLAGLWIISARMQDDKIVPIHRTGTRKTIKILSSTRFQWAAIGPGTKQFMGTGGGRYIFENGKYTENIEFFSRDSSRVGQSLSFDGKLENGDWHHSGKSSGGNPIYEVWSRNK